MALPSYAHRDQRGRGVALALAATTAAAQDNAVKSAADAFGERVGTEQSGLYSETQVRGFNLNESGAWSVDAALRYSGERWADTANTFKTPTGPQKAGLPVTGPSH